MQYAWSIGMLMIALDIMYVKLQNRSAEADGLEISFYI